jgi:flagellar basal body-associated protein FliL
MANRSKITEPSLSPSTVNRWFIVIGVIAAIVLAAVIIIYAMDLKKEVSSLKNINEKLLNESSQQKELARQQRDINSSMLDITKQQLDLTKNMLDITRVTGIEVQDANSKLDASLGLQQQLLNSAMATLQQAREINRKMPPPIPASSLPVLP